MECTDSTTCTLGSDDLAERVRAWRAVSALATSRRVEATRVTSVYPSDPALVRRLRELVEAEGRCCGFLEFTIDEGPAETVVELSFPPEARALIEAILPAAPGANTTGVQARS